MDADEAKPKRRPGVSLLNLLLMSGIVATTLVAWRAQREATALRRQNFELTYRIAGLDLTDPARGYARLVRGSLDDPLSFTWQTYTPPGTPSQLRLRCGETSQTLALPGGVCGVCLQCLPVAEGYVYILKAGSSAISLQRIPQRPEASSRLESQVVPAWAQPETDLDAITCLGGWPLDEGAIGSTESWNATTERELLVSPPDEVLSDESVGIRLTIEPIPAEPVTPSSPVR